MIALCWERLYPTTFGFGGAIVGYLYGPYILHEFYERQWAIENIFVATFTLGTVAAGFGLTIYTFLLTTESGFIGRAKRSIYYRHMLTYVLNATVMSSISSIVSIPGMIVKESPNPLSIHALYIALWSSIIVWTIATLVRAGLLFSVFAREHHYV